MGTRTSRFQGLEFGNVELYSQLVCIGIIYMGLEPTNNILISEDSTSNPFLSGQDPVFFGSCFLDDELRHSENQPISKSPNTTP